MFEFGIPTVFCDRHTAELLFEFDIPVVFCDRYAIGIDIVNEFFGGDRLQNHPIDFHKFEKIAKILKAKFGELYTNIEKISDDELSLYHDTDYLKALSGEKTVIEDIFRTKLPEGMNAAVLNRFLVDPARHMTAGTVAASRLAMECGWAINLGGGFHHAKRDTGSGFCFFNDFAVATKLLKKTHPKLKILYIDLDAHIGDGVISFAKECDDFWIVDIYNAFKGLGDTKQIVKSTVDGKITTIGIEPYTSDDAYLPLVYKHISEAIERIKPDFIFYNGGGDILVGDKLGCLNISAEAICKRDMFVFSEAQKSGIPIAMCLSGGYGDENYKSIAESLVNICETKRGLYEKQ